MGAIARRDLLRGAVAVPALLAAPAQHGIAGVTALEGRHFGTAVRTDILQADDALRRRLAADTDWLTPEIDFKWNALEYRRGGWWFERADALAAFAQANGKGLRGHTLLWDQSTPDWARQEMLVQRDWRLIERWFTTALGRYGAAAAEWDIVNEPIDTQGGAAGLRTNCFHRAFGPDYIARSLHLARSLAPTTRLMINEYGLEYGNDVERDRRRALLKLVEQLKRDGVPLDGVGVQAHLDLSKGPLAAREIVAMLREIAGMGLSVTITELDVKEADRSRSLVERDRATADAVARYLDVILDEPVVRGVVTWGFTDRDSWLQDGLDAGRPETLNRGLPLDHALRPKPIYAALRRALRADQA